jgi:GNAT superfamily N-acetyltransferase
VLLVVADEIRLAEAVPGDEHAIADLYAKIDEFYGGARREDPGIRAERARAALFGDPPAGRALLAWDDTTLAGFAGYQLIWPSIAMTTSLYLKELFVCDGYRASGLGRLLMAGLRDVAVARGCSRIEWTTDTGNLSAQRFYESLGTAPMESKLFYRDTRGLPHP